MSDSPSILPAAELRDLLIPPSLCSRLINPHFSRNVERESISRIQFSQINPPLIIWKWNRATDREKRKIDSWRETWDAKLPSYFGFLDLWPLNFVFFVWIFPMINGKTIKFTGERAKHEVWRKTMTEERWDQCYVIQTFCQYREPPIRGARFSIDRISRLHFARGVSSLYVHCE